MLLPASSIHSRKTHPKNVYYASGSSRATPVPESGLELNHQNSTLFSISAISAVDPLTLAITECMAMLLAMRKVTRWQHSGVAAILGGGSDFYDDDSLTTGLGLLGAKNTAGAQGSGSSSTTANPLVLSFIQLRSILSEAKNINDLDSLTILQPFLLIIKLPLTSGHITSLALDSISKFLSYRVLSIDSPNLTATLVQICSALTHCRFEAADQSSDDAVLLKVLRLMERVITCEYSSSLSNDVVLEVVQTCLSLACNKRRSEVLRCAAEMAIGTITARVFAQLKELAPELLVESVVVDASLPADVIGSAIEPSEDENRSSEETNKSEQKDSQETSEEKSSEDAEKADNETAETEESTQQPEEAADDQAGGDSGFDVAFLHEFTSILISMISPSNQYQHMESTRVLALKLLNTAVEVSGAHITTHPSLMALFADPVSKHVLLIITSAESPALLEAAWRVFATMTVVLGPYLKSQIELTFSLIFATAESSGSTGAQAPRTGAASTFAAPAAKEMILESLSLLWTRDPGFFVRLYADYDCDFDRTDLAKQLIEFICRLALPELAKDSTDNVPPICLEGLLAFVNGINERVKQTDNSQVQQVPKKLTNKANKKAFIECTDAFNKKPAIGIQDLHKHGFIKDANNIEEVAEFIYNKLGRLNKKVLGEYLAKPSNKPILKHFISLFNYEGLRVDEAIRLLLKTFRLPGEAQQIERIVELFAERYAECQENDTTTVSDEQSVQSVRPNKDSVFILSYSIILLNTDLHNPQVKKQMTLDAYKKNLRGTFNGGDYPEWYLSKIYSNIRDREIIMPEEHHGTEKWFDDIWNNLVSADALSEVDEHNSEDLSAYDKYLFSEVVEVITATLVQIFNEASDDHIITRLMSTIDKLVNICLYFGLDDAVDKLVGFLADLTTLTDPSRLKRGQEETDDNLRDEIPITQIKLDSKEETITVSDMAVWFGRDFKAQISTVVLFRLLKKTRCHVTPSWKQVVKIILTLYENCLVDPNLFSDFQKTLRLPALSRAKPRYIINRVKPLKDSGILLTFSSFLKGYSDEPPEPTDLEVESTLSTIDCVKSLNLTGIFTALNEATVEDKTFLCRLFLKAVPEQHDDTLKRYYELELLFVIEMVTSLALSIENKELMVQALSKITRTKSQLSKKGELRLVVYELILWKEVGPADFEVVEPAEETTEKSDVQPEASTKEHKEKSDTPIGPSVSFDWLLALEKDILTKNGSALVAPIFGLVEPSSPFKTLLNSELYWKVLRVLGSIPVFSPQALKLTESIIKDSVVEITTQNFVHLLGLLDEISSVGALASQWEHGNEQTKKSADTEYLKELIDTSKKSISLTADLARMLNQDGFNADNGGYPLLQALAHQCFNPCREIRGLALSTLKTTILSLSENQTVLPASGAFQYGLFPLLGELAKPSVVQTDPHGFYATQLESLSLCSKVFLQFLGSLEDLDHVWFGILDGFKTFNDLTKGNEGVAVDEEASELLKNMLLVLQDGGPLDRQNKQFWDNTWSKVGEIYPNLQPEIVETVEETKEATEEKTEEKSAEEEPPVKEQPDEVD